jgi:hypothetical protein
MGSPLWKYPYARQGYGKGWAYLCCDPVSEPIAMGTACDCPRFGISMLAWSGEVCRFTGGHRYMHHHHRAVTHGCIVR